MIDYFLNPQSVEALGWTLLHSLWQGAIFAILLVLILIALRSYSAQSRYVVSVGLLCAFFLTLSGTFYLQWQDANNQIGVTAQLLDKQSADDQLILNNSASTLLKPASGGNNMLSLSSEIKASNQSGWLLEFRDYYDRHLPLLVTIWLLGVLFLQLRFLGQLAYVQRLKHYGTQLFPASWSNKIDELEGKLRIQKKVSYLTSLRIESPMVIGWLKPVVLMPRQLLDSLSETEIYAVLAHELAHIRREDFLVNLLQTFLCNVFFFHPGVWWMSNRIDEEREHCCDDLAVAATGPATSYAKTLINVSELQLKMQNNTPLAMAFSGKNKKRERVGFSGRIRRLFTVSKGAGSFREGFATAFILITALFLGVVVTGSTTQAIDTPSPSEIVQTETNFDSEDSNKIDQKQSPKITTTTTTIRTENHPISNVIQEGERREFPVATLAKPVAPLKPDTRDETRIDALVMACSDGDLDFVKTLIKSGIDINGIGTDGFTPLMEATSKKKANIVNYLIKQGADVNLTFNGWTALLEAADEGSLTSMKYLLKAGADVNFYWTQQSPTAINIAASEGHLDCLKLLLDQGADINGFGQSVPPLHIAAEENKRIIIDYLLSQNANINEKDAAGRTALMYAASEGHRYAVKELINAGADILTVDLNGATASDYAEEEEAYSIRYYIERELRNKPITRANSRDAKQAGKRPEIHQATLDGHIEKVQRMVEEGKDVNTIDNYGRTPLHIASAEGHNIDMRVLIDLGADINVQDKQGRTPLMYAAADGKKDAVVLLVSKLADINIQDVDGMRAYEWGQSGGNPDLVQFLGLITENNKLGDKKENSRNSQNNDIQKEEEKRVHKEMIRRAQKEEEKDLQKIVEKGESFHVAADGTHLKQLNIKEKTPALLEAVRNGSLEECANLLSKGLPVNVADDTGQTALMVAARTNRLDIAEFLIKQGAYVNKSSASGLTALHYAALENYDDMTKLLLKNNANIDATMRYSSTDGNYSKEPFVWEYIGATPLLIAVESGNAEVVSVLIDAGANTRHSLIRNEYILNKDRVSYLSGSEVMGLDKDFLKEVKFQTSDETWTPLKQALLLNDPAILAFFPK